MFLIAGVLLCGKVGMGEGDAATAITVNVNGMAAEAALYTAMDHSLVSESLARSLRIQKGARVKVDSDTAHDIIAHAAASPLYVELGGSKLHGIKLVISDDTTVTRLARNPHAQVVLGAEFFKNRVVHIAFPAGALSVEPHGADACAGAPYVRFFVMAGDPVVPLPAMEIVIDGREGVALVDPRLDDALFVIGNGDHQLSHEVSLTVGPVQHRVRPRPLDRGERDIFDIPFVIGKQAFGNSVLTIDGKRGKLCIKPREGLRF